jgi:hypothetical protein
MISKVINKHLIITGSQKYNGSGNRMKRPWRWKKKKYKPGF